MAKAFMIYRRLAKSQQAKARMKTTYDVVLALVDPSKVFCGLLGLVVLELVGQRHGAVTLSKMDDLFNSVLRGRFAIDETRD